MMGKLFLLALIGVSLVQAEENEFVKQGLEKVNRMKTSVEGRVNDVIGVVNDNRNYIDNDMMARTIKLNRDYRKGIRNLSNINKRIKQKATDEKCAEKVFKCIEFFYQHGLEKRGNAVSGFQTYHLDITTKLVVPRLEKVAQNLTKLPTQSEIILFKVRRQIKQCQNKECVDKAIDEYSKWVDETVSPTIDNMIQEISFAYRNYVQYVHYKGYPLYAGIVLDCSADEADMRRCIPKKNEED